MNEATQTPSQRQKPLEVVFFGHTRSGKTELLRKTVLACSLEAEDAPLDLMAAEPTPIQRELIPHKIFVDLPDDYKVASSVILYDCNSAAAGDLLRNPDQLKQKHARSALTAAIRSADALVVVVDAHWRQQQIDTTFADFREFLRAFEEGRAFRRDVQGLPVLLVLTKCDMLFDPEESTSAWYLRIEQAKRSLAASFAETFDLEENLIPETEEAPAESVDPFAEEEEKPWSPAVDFGKIQLGVVATAAQLPPDRMLAGNEDRTGGYNIESFANQVLHAAASYRSRVVRSRRRLNWTAAGTLSLLTAFVLALLIMAGWSEPGPTEKLTGRVRSLMAMEGSAAVRLSDRNYAGNLKELEAIRLSTAFPSLPEDLQDFIRLRLQEFHAYGQYRSKFRPPQFSPAEVRTRNEFTKLEQELDSVLHPPAEYATAWQETEALRLREKWRQDLGLIKKNTDLLHDWYRALIGRATMLLLVETPTVAWREEVAGLLAEANRQPFPPSNVIPESQSIPVRRGQAITYALAFQQERADSARRDWEAAAQKLTDLRDLCLVLGLIPSDGQPLAILDLPEPIAESGPSLILATDRLKLLNERFPRAISGQTEWTASAFPDPIRRELARKLRLCVDTGFRHVRKLLLTELALPAGQPDRPADWDRLLEGILLQKELTEWGKFLRLLRHWADPNQPDVDPVTELIAFLKKPTIESRFREVTLFLPTSLRVEQLKPNTPLTIEVTGPRQQVVSLKLNQRGTGDAVEGGTRYTFVPEKGETTLLIRPGDQVEAKLGLKAEVATYQLTWSSARTTSFAGEKLASEPVISRVQATVAPQRATGVVLGFVPEGQNPRVPDLLPATTGNLP